MNKKNRALCHSSKAKFIVAVLTQSPLRPHPIPNNIDPIIALAFSSVCSFFLIKDSSIRFSLSLKT